MIHAKDLMIGDWLFAIGDDGKKHICRANDIKQDLVNNTEDFSVDFFGTDFDPVWPDIMFNVEPIPLTPEILEKNGFYKDELTRHTSQWILNDDYYDIIVYKVSDSIWCIEYDNTEANLPTRRNLVCFVHELQHRIKMFGVEKSFEL